MQPTLPGVEESVHAHVDRFRHRPRPRVGGPHSGPAAATCAVPAPAPAVQPVASDAPYCYQCGMVMQRAGACFVCSTCGTTSGCS